ncbi:5'-nucleotidase C-terminal domain-containing protein [Streptomyces sp. NPDC006463]|uniref:5'-nucleotidase C-terminal domain-containing protein n=1 Tax=Streptomyces sp. NPDC006463 TaxID=3364746 RepID=UPI0036C1924B
MGYRVSVEDVTVDGVPLDPARSYRLATLSYTFLGHDGYPALADFREPYRHQRDFESFVAFVQERQTLTPPPVNRVSVRNDGLVPGWTGTVVEPAAPLDPDGAAPRGGDRHLRTPDPAARRPPATLLKPVRAADGPGAGDRGHPMCSD